MKTRSEFDQALKSLQDDLTIMSEMVEQTLAQAKQALLSQDAELADQIIKKDVVIDKLHLQIEDRCLKLIALQQPAGKDLRKISAAMRLTIEFERMADIAVGIAKKVKLISNEPFIKPLVDLPLMAELGQQMVSMGIQAYLNEDVELAVKMSQLDEEIDALYKQLFREILTYMLEDPRHITQGAHLLFIARFLERFGDHATNVAEVIVYLVTGERKSLND